MNNCGAYFVRKYGGFINLMLRGGNVAIIAVGVVAVVELGVVLGWLKKGLCWGKGRRGGGEKDKGNDKDNININN